MLEVRFYHLTRRSLEEALPRLLEMSLERAWRVAVQTGDGTRLKALDDHLWSYDPEKFLPHGTKSDGEPETQPIYLTAEGDNPNEADVRFFVHGASAVPLLGDPAAAPRLRAVVMFNGSDSQELLEARAQWKALRETRHELVYYQEDENGKWIEKSRHKNA
ncbi:DNA polymerase III subunit chi [Methylocystis bryophila]|uniref:DNA polymerase III subunit chi n=1 Tax=Methylocystis bryophila TaxID=655015 RepID=A0A1W6MVW1_9HYPH|nr:DNA polymerase III subunit chi [Methylocystis bryophila]ARN81656.1 DNA polymerase III subunit chi [Methylocystis bryophila]BDV37700.1 DNA polymerase III subunit chi [Methylocystis bryophila]